LHDGAQFRRIGAACKQAESGGALGLLLLPPLNHPGSAEIAQSLQLSNAACEKRSLNAYGLCCPIFAGPAGIVDGVGPVAETIATDVVGARAAVDDPVAQQRALLGGSNRGATNVATR
jgi:hypothetical protein